jgi:hypothetical protein
MIKRYVNNLHLCKECFWADDDKGGLPIDLSFSLDFKMLLDGDSEAIDKKLSIGTCLVFFKRVFADCGGSMRLKLFYLSTTSTVIL